MNYKGVIAEEIELCRYCYCTPTPSKFPKTTWVNGTTTTETPNISPPQQIIQV